MSTTTLRTISDIQTCVKENSQVHVVGKSTKSALSVATSDVTVMSLSGLTGITEYEPEEYTITANAGTPVQEIQDALSKNGQYLPFDPMLSKTATIGGSVASNLSGSRRFRYGGIRDFILGAHVVDGLGRAFRVGGKVVKNSAGFDLPKFLVGSLGKYAIFTDLTFKIFPEAPAYLTLNLQFGTLERVLSAIFFLNQSMFELDALDFVAEDSQWNMWIRMAGNEDTLPRRTERLLNTLKNHTPFTTISEAINDPVYWDRSNNLRWADNSTSVVKVVMSPKQIPALDADLLPLAERRYSVGGNIAWVATEDLDALSLTLQKHQLTGLTVLGTSDAPIVGKPIDNVLSERIKHVLDPNNKLI